MPLFGSITSDINFSKIAEGQNYANAVMVFVQTNAPTYWTKDTSMHDYALRVTTGSVTINDGDVGFSTVFSPGEYRRANGSLQFVFGRDLSITPSGLNPSLSVGATSLTVAQLPAHDHEFDYANTANYMSAPPAVGGPIARTFSTAPIRSSGNNQSHTHTLGDVNYAPTAPISSALPFNVKYVDCIIARFDGV